MEATKKYIAKIEKYNKYLGRVEANTKKELREKVREHCSNWGHSGRVYVSQADGASFNEFTMNV